MLLMLFHSGVSTPFWKLEMHDTYINACGKYTFYILYWVSLSCKIYFALKKHNCVIHQDSDLPRDILAWGGHGYSAGFHETKLDRL